MRNAGRSWKKKYMTTELRRERNWREKKKRVVWKIKCTEEKGERDKEKWTLKVKS